MTATAIGGNHPATGRFSPIAPTTWGTARHRLGAHEADGGAAWTFAVYSKNAERVLLELYDAPSGAHARHDYWMAQG